VLVSLPRRTIAAGVSVGLVAVLAAFFTITANLFAHEIPNDVRIQAFLKPEGQRLRLIVRAPLEAMNDIDWPIDALGMLNLPLADRALRDASTLWLADNIDVYEGDRRLEYPRVVEVRASLPSDMSFQSYESALTHVTGPRLPDDTEFVKNQGLLDVLFEYPIESDRSYFSIEAKFARLGIQVVTVLRFLPPDGAERAFELHGDAGFVRLDPRWHQAAWRFVVSGFFHILDGVDHLLFLFCLVIPFRRFGPLVTIVTAFTVAHSITLIASAYNMAPDAGWFPPLVETLIATSIVYMALENIVSPGLGRRWLITFLFGLVHGFGFSFALRETLQFAGSHLLTSLLSFNVGVELGQLLVLVLLVPALELLFRFGVAERIGTIILSALVAHTGWHWMTERYGQLRLYTFEWPVFDAAFFADVVRWLMLLVIAAGAAWLMSLLGRQLRGGAKRETPIAEET
jgi:hypothetical protein